MQTTFQESQSGALEMQSQLQLMTEEIAILQTSKDQVLEYISIVFCVTAIFSGCPISVGYC